jgi:hypothetical protein
MGEVRRTRIDNERSSGGRGATNTLALPWFQGRGAGGGSVPERAGLLTHRVGAVCNAAYRQVYLK